METNSKIMQAHPPFMTVQQNPEVLCKIKKTRHRQKITAWNDKWSHMEIDTIVLPPKTEGMEYGKEADVTQ